MWWLVACALAHPSPHSIVAGRRPQPHNDGMDEPAQCLVWRRAPVGMVLTTAPRPTRGTSCIPMSFHRFNQAEARELIARKRILLVGDSVASYWYLSLAHFLHSGDTLKEWDTSKRGHAHPLFEQYWSRIGKSWRGAQWWAWNTFYNGTSADFGGNEICDCYREPCFPKCVPQSYVGNRHFRIGSEARVHFIPWLGHTFRPRGHDLNEVDWSLHCGAHMEGTQRRRCATGSAAAWDTANASSAEDVLDALAHRFNPDLLLIDLVSNWPDRTIGSVCPFAKRYGQRRQSTGASRHWLQLDTGKWNFASAAMWKQVNATHSCVMPGSADRWLPVPALIARLLLLEPRKRVFLDRVHFTPWVYHELNQLLLNTLVNRQQ